MTLELTQFHTRDDQAAVLDWLVSKLSATLAAQGHRVARSLSRERADDEKASIVLHAVDTEAPYIFRRRSRAIFVVGLAVQDQTPDDILATGYPLLVRTLSNLFILISRTGRQSPHLQAHFITLERGCYSLTATGDTQEFFTAMAERIVPLATARLVLDNVFHRDLPERLWEGDAITEAISRAGQRLDALNLLPPAVVVKDLLSPRDYRHCQRLYSIGGLSYGNLSARRDENTFWMSASGVDKGRLRTIGEEILLVKGYDPKTNAIQLSVPPDCTPRRVSVDAIEHYLIYQEHPSVGAIVHIHAWMDGVRSTMINYPCGTIELGQAVAELVRQSDDPSRAVVGLKNHGLTITGPNLDDIFDRIEGRVLPEVPMS